MGSHRSLLFILAGLGILSVLVALDEQSGTSLILIPLYGAAPLFAALGSGLGATVLVGAAAVVAAVAMGVRFDDLDTDQGLVRVFTVALTANLAAWTAYVRRRQAAGLEREARLRRELAEAFGLLDEIFERAPVGLAMFDRELRFQRINDRLAEMNGVPAADHVGRAVSDVLPHMDPDVEATFRRVRDEGVTAADIEVVGETPARPGEMRTWLLSCWPVRRRGEEEVIGVGAVVVEVTEERRAARALRGQTDRYETLLLALSEVGEGMVVLENDRLVYANPAFERLSGYALEELRAMEDVFALTEPETRDDARRRARARVEEGRVDPNYSLTLRRRDGSRVELEVAGVPLEVDDRRQLVIVGRDVTARRRAEAGREAALRRTEFLAEASERFDEVLDVERTLGIVAHLAVREFADACRVSLHGSALEASAGLPPERAPTGLRLSLRARGRRLGVMELGFAEPLVPERESELRGIFVDLARRAALAIDNARLYQERSDVARTLQRSLLPADLPDIPGLQLAARYVASGSGNEVGGDFYDCFSTGGGEWALVIGDVCGKGAEAASVTALARYTIRAAVLHTRGPADVLAELNEALLRQSLDYRFCTALYATLCPEGDGVEVTLASGGHPLPLVLRATGEVESVGEAGTLLGIVADPVLSARSVHLGPGDAMVLYTDGVIEASPGDDAFGPEHFAEFLATLSGRDADGIANLVEREVLEIQGGSPRDDVALLVARLPPSARG